MCYYFVLDWFIAAVCSWLVQSVLESTARDSSEARRRQKLNVEDVCAGVEIFCLSDGHLLQANYKSPTSSTFE